MKKLLVFAAVASIAAPALASKARVNALGNAEHLVDAQTVFDNNAYLAELGDYVTFEMGPTNPTYSTTALPSNTAGAEGGFVRSMGDAKYMFYMGRKDDFTTANRALLGFKGQENPLEFHYATKGAINMGYSFNYSNGDTKSGTVPQKGNTMGARVGATTDTWEASLGMGLAGGATGNVAKAGIGLAADANGKYTGTALMRVTGAYKMDNLYSFVKYQNAGMKYESTVNAASWDGAKIGATQMDLGVVDHTKIEGGEWFYGVSYRSVETKIDGAALSAINTKTTTTSLPFLLGMEYDLNSWATVRASASQNVLLGSTKTGSGEADTIENNTTVAAGLGLKFNKWILDGSWSAGSTGDVNTTNFMTNAALTYNF